MKAPVSHYLNESVWVAGRRAFLSRLRVNAYLLGFHELRLARASRSQKRLNKRFDQVLPLRGSAGRANVSAEIAQHAMMTCHYARICAVRLWSSTNHEFCTKTSGPVSLGMHCAQYMCKMSEKMGGGTP
jgi:hypothetical protein